MGKPSKEKLAKVKSLDELKHQNKIEYKMFLAGGIVFSRKTIYYNKGKFHIINHVDGSRQSLTEAEIMDEDFTNIGASIKYGTFYKSNQ